MRDDGSNKMNTVLASEKNVTAALRNRRQSCVLSRGLLKRSRGGYVMNKYVCYGLILLLMSQYTDSSVAPSSTSISSKKSQGVEENRQLEIHKNHRLRPSSSIMRNPFKSERTIVSGFGSRSIRKTIFGRRSMKSKKKRIKEDNDKNIDTENNLLPEMESPKMWVQRPKYNSDGKEDDVLWILVRDENPKDANSVNNNRVVLKLTFDDEKDDWVAKRATQKEESNFVRHHPVDKWIPIEGLYGIYKVPSGVLCILIAGSEAVYDAPPIPSASSQVYKTSPWWQIRRVTNLEIVHLGNKGYHSREPTLTTSPRPKLMIAQSKATLLTASRLREEVRQISLLRKALKQHDFYYVPNSNGRENDGNPQVVCDMTKNLQRSIIEASSNQKGSKYSWWKELEKSKDDQPKLMPDSRFFWNQQAVEPLLQRYKEEIDEGEASPLSKQITELLLQHAVPLTSAFVGVQKNITISNENASSNISSSTVTSYDELLISRRSRFRAGTRFTVRGADASGNCANFAETEQICLMATTIPKEMKEKTDDDISECRSVKSIASHVQTRGSIPLRWSSPADVKTYRPRVNIGADPLAQARALRLHILDQLQHYALHVDEQLNTKTAKGASHDVADIVFVNLVDKHSDQGRLGRAFDAVLRAVVDVHASDSSNNSVNVPSGQKGSSHLPKHSARIEADSVKHVWYDFHAEVKNARWDRLRLLLEEVQPALTSHGYFVADAPLENHQENDDNNICNGWSIRRLQNAVVRTNCMDCLDRTNVVQSIFGRYMLFQQLSNEAGESPVKTENQNVWANLNKLFQKNSLTLPWSSGEVAHRLLWADNADAISRLYAGTPALKGDFTRTGQRTKKGALDDGMNSLQRYYLNNFLDADRQEGYDLLVGHATFSNVVEENSIEEDRIDMSFTGATRESILSDIVQGSSYQNRKDLQDRLEEIGVSKQPNLDLRWLPGDLQTQVRDQANDDIRGDENDEQNKSEEISSTSAIRNRGAFDSQQAMKAIDERSHVELPWWSNSDEDWLKIGADEKYDAQEDKHVIDKLSQHRSQVILTPLELAMVLYVGLKAPTALGAMTVAILSFVYLPECIRHDYQQPKLFKSYIESRLNDDDKPTPE